MTASLGILVLAGGDATRLPGKLALPVSGTRADDAETLPMLVHVFRNMAHSQRGDREIVIAGKGTFSPEIDALLDAPLVIDRWTRRGPLAGLLTAMARMRSRYVFAAAGDAPNLTAAFADALAARMVPGDEAIVPERAPNASDAEAGVRAIEPLAAVYDRLAFLREGLPVLRSGRGALRLVLARLRTRYVIVDDADTFANVNTPDDYRALVAGGVAPPDADAR
jgi:molybdopterin-guanine dinucleotide biosynthesis protein A